MVLEDITERRRNLTSILTKGYIDQAVFTKETNDMVAEEADLKEERDRLKREISGDMKKAEALRELIEFTGKGETLAVFGSELFERIVDHVTVRNRDEAVLFAYRVSIVYAIVRLSYLYRNGNLDFILGRRGWSAFDCSRNHFMISFQTEE